VCRFGVWDYKILFGIVDVQPGEFFELNVRPSRGHQYKLYKKRNVSCVRSTFFSERLANVWNSLPDSTNFSTLPRFRRSIQRVLVSLYLLASRFITNATIRAYTSLVCLAHCFY